MFCYRDCQCTTRLINRMRNLCQTIMLSPARHKHLYLFVLCGNWYWRIRVGSAQLSFLEGILLATVDVRGKCGIVAVSTGVSGSGVVDIVGCSVVLHIPWLFLKGLPDPVVMFTLVTSLLISLYGAMLFIHGSMLSNANIIL